MKCELCGTPVKVGGRTTKYYIPEGTDINAVNGQININISDMDNKLKIAIEALEWYANWDWSDKYVQAVPKRAKETLKKLNKPL